MPPKRPFLVVAAAVALLALPVRAAAQKEAFIDAFVSFHSALAGTYGDEGPRVEAALDRMSATLAAWEEARRAEEAALKGRPGITPAELALFHADHHQLDAAIAAAGQAIAAEPRRAQLHVLQGLLHEAAGQVTEAARAFEAARQLDPSDSLTAYLAAASRAERPDAGPLSAFVETLMAAVERGDLSRSRAPFGRFALIEDLWSDTPIFSPAAYADGFALMAQRRFPQAIERFRTVAGRDPLVVDPARRSDRMARGLAALRERRGTAAVTELEAAVAALPSSPEAHRVLGVAYRAVGRLADSIAQFETAARLAPGDERSRVALAGALAEAGRYAEAETSLRETIAALPASGEARWALADVYERAGRGVEAIAPLDAAASLTVLAGKSHLYWRIAELTHGYRRDYSHAIAVLVRRARLLPNEPHAHKDLGLAYARAGRDDEALLELLMAALMGLEDGETLGTIGQIHLNAGRFAQAEGALQRAVALDPERPQARYALATALQRLGRTGAAKPHLDAFQRLQAEALAQQKRVFDIDIALRDGERLERAGRLEDAAVAYEKAAALGGPPETYRTLASIYARLGRKADSARAQATYEQRQAAVPAARDQ